jgi:hypothetical protein
MWKNGKGVIINAGKTPVQRDSEYQEARGL